jgi:integrase
MNAKEIQVTSEGLYGKMKQDGYSKSVLETTRWIINHFEKFCREQKIHEINVPVIARFLLEKYDIDYQNPTAGMQTVLRRPLLILMEFYESGNYCKSHQRGTTTEIPEAFSGIFLACRKFINSLEISIKSKKRKLWIIVNFLTYLQEAGKRDIAAISAKDVNQYIVSIADYAHATRRIYAGTLREILDWMHREKMITFSGRDAFPVLRKSPKSDILSYYSADEIKTIIKSIDGKSTSSKTYRFIISITAFLGIRAGDLINLKFNDIDWANNRINIVQAKTGTPLTLPMPDEVKFPLLDYLKNVRRTSADNEYILVTSYAPYTRIHHTASIYRMISKCIEHSNLPVNGRRKGPHALRHSLATNLLSDNVPLSAISNILGHSSTKTTEIYLGVDERNLKELSLEVEHVL